MTALDGGFSGEGRKARVLLHGRIAQQTDWPSDMKVEHYYDE